MIGFLEQLDHYVFFLINIGLGRQWLDPVFHGFSVLGEWTICIVAMAFLAQDGRRRLYRHILAVLLILTVFSTFNSEVKRIVRRPRPAALFHEQVKEGPAEIRIVGEKLYKKSFPSGHSLLAFFMMTYVGLCKREYRFWAILIATMIAFSRIYVGAHFPSDCISGSLLGVLGGYCAWQVFVRFSRRERKS